MYRLLPVVLLLLHVAASAVTVDMLSNFNSEKADPPESIERSREADVVFSALTSVKSNPTTTQLKVDLFNDTEPVVQIDTVEEYGQDYVLLGTVIGFDAPTEAIISVSGNVVYAQLFFNEELYQIQYTGNPKHEIVQFTSEETECGTTAAGASGDDKFGEGVAIAPVDLDVLFVWSEQVQAGFAGSTSARDAKWRAEISYANRVFSESNTFVHLNLVGSSVIPYDEGGLLSRDIMLGEQLEDLTHGRNGLGKAHALRDQFGADIVVLYIQGHIVPIVNGLAERVWGAFTVLDSVTLDLRSVLAHEVGHLLGLYHSLETATPTYAKGYHFGLAFQTVMGNHPLKLPINRFSDPNATWLLSTIGNASTANARRLLNETVLTAAIRRVREAQKLVIVDSQGNPVAQFNDSGLILLKGSIFQPGDTGYQITPQAAEDEFVVMSGGTPRARLEASTGNLHLQGDIVTNVGSLYIGSGSAKWAIRDAADNVAVTIDESGTLKTRHIVVENYDFN